MSSVPCQPKLVFRYLYPTFLTNDRRRKKQLLFRIKTAKTNGVIRCTDVVGPVTSAFAASPVTLCSAERRKCDSVPVWTWKDYRCLCDKIFDPDCLVKIGHHCHTKCGICWWTRPKEIAVIKHISSWGLPYGYRVGKGKKCLETFCNWRYHRPETKTSWSSHINAFKVTARS